VLREEYINDDSKRSSHGSENYDLTTGTKKKAGRKNLRTIDFYHSRKYFAATLLNQFSKLCCARKVAHCTYK
jgi:hypothetical protein